MTEKNPIEIFSEDRQRLNDLVMKYAGLHTKRFFNLDSQVYQDQGKIPVKIKELMGLVASLVLRCDDCIKYHVIRCFDEGVSDGELEETMSIGLIVGGSITIPHLRRAYDAWEDLKEKKKSIQKK